MMILMPMTIGTIMSMVYDYVKTCYYLLFVRWLFVGCCGTQISVTFLSTELLRRTHRCGAIEVDGVDANHRFW